MIEIETPEIRVGKNESGEYAEIVIPEEFNPGSIMVFATDMDVRLPPLFLLSSPPLSLPTGFLRPKPLFSHACRPFIHFSSYDDHVFYISHECFADKQEMSPDLDSSIQSGAVEAFAELDLVDLNVILHRADGEEKDATGESRPFSSSSSPCALGPPSVRLRHLPTMSDLLWLASARILSRTDS